MKKIKRFLSLLLILGLFFLTGCINNTPTVPVEPDVPVLPDIPVEPDVPVTPDKPEKPEIFGDIEIYDNKKATNTKLNVTVEKDKIYSQKEEVALYLVTFKELPSNYYSRSEFNKIKNQWTPQNLISCTGGNFRNKEGRLPKNDSYIECDIDYRGGGRNALRIVFNVSYTKVYYTSDHYLSFVRVYDGYNYDGVTQYA